MAPVLWGLRRTWLALAILSLSNILRTASGQAVIDLNLGERKSHQISDEAYFKVRLSQARDIQKPPSIAFIETKLEVS